MTVQVNEGRVPDPPKPLANDGRGYTVDEGASRLKEIFSRARASEAAEPPDQPEALPQRRERAAEPDQTDERRGPDGRFKSALERNLAEEADAAPQETEPSGETESVEPEPETPPIEPPRSWDADQRDQFAKLTPEAQRVVLAHESRRDAELRRVQNETAEKAKAYEAELSAAQAERQHLSAALSEVQSHLKADLAKVEAEIGKYEKVDWNAAFDQDPVAAAKADRYLRNLQDRRRDILEAGRLTDQQRQELDAKTREEQTKAARETAAKEKARLVEAIPEWKDAAKMQAGLAEVAEYLTDVHGVPAERLANINDALSIMVARDAMKWHKLQTGKPAMQKRVEAAPKMAKPAAQQDAGTRVSDAKAQAEQAHKKHGTLETLAAVLKHRGYSDNPRRR